MTYGRLQTKQLFYLKLEMFFENINFIRLRLQILKKIRLKLFLKIALSIRIISTQKTYYLAKS